MLTRRCGIRIYELRFISTSSFVDMNFLVSDNWDFKHTDPTGTQTGKDEGGKVPLQAGRDLAATMACNPNMKVLVLNGYFDSVTPFFQTELDLANMPLCDDDIRGNLATKCYPSGHMTYLHGPSRTAMKLDLRCLYEQVIARGLNATRLRPARPG